MVSGVGVMVSAFCLRERSSARSLQYDATGCDACRAGSVRVWSTVFPACCPQLHRYLPRAVRHQTLGGRVARPLGPSYGFVDSLDFVLAPASRGGALTRRLWRPAAGASHAPSGVASTLCHVQGVLLRSGGIWERLHFLPAVLRCRAKRDAICKPA